MTKKKAPVEVNVLDGPGYFPDYYKPAQEPETKEADLSGAPMLAHLKGAELEALLTLLQGMEEKEAAQARASLAHELAERNIPAEEW